MMKTYAPIALGIAIGIFSLPVVSKGLANAQENNSAVHEQAPEPRKEPSKIIRDNPPAKASSQKYAIDADTIKNKASPEMHVNPCNGNTPPSWC